MDVPTDATSAQFCTSVCKLNGQKGDLFCLSPLASGPLNKNAEIPPLNVAAGPPSHPRRPTSHNIMNLFKGMSKAVAGTKTIL